MLTVFKGRLKLREFEHTIRRDIVCQALLARFVQIQEFIKRIGARIERDGEMLPSSAHYADKSDLIALRILYAEDFVLHHPLPWRHLLHTSGVRIKPSPFLDGRFFFSHKFSSENWWDRLPTCPTNFR